jgi:AraC-like DNA-binding protein
MFQVRSTCQSFQCMAALSDRSEFGAALSWLGTEVPAPGSIQECDALKDRLMLCGIEAGTTFHQNFHKRVPGESCRESPVETTLSDWSSSDADLRRTYSRWAERYLAAFDSTHTIPAVERAAEILRRRFADAPDLDSLAQEVGAGRSTLTQRFREHYGMSCGEYLMRVKLREFVNRLRDSDASASQVAVQAGFSRYHNLTEALRLRTGRTPGDVRRLTLDDARELVDVFLATAPGRSGGSRVQSGVAIRAARVDPIEVLRS